MAKSMEIVSSGQLQKQFGRYSDGAPWLWKVANIQKNRAGVQFATKDGGIRVRCRPHSGRGRRDAWLSDYASLIRPAGAIPVGRVRPKAVTRRR